MMQTTSKPCLHDHTHLQYLLPDRLMSDEIRDIVQWFLFTVTCPAIVIFGVVSNIINIICFVKQGFKDPVNISFLGLAISDLGSLVTLLWSDICMNPAFIAADLPFDPIDFQHLTGAWPHATFSRITSWITALITLERCLCIALPLKVKFVVTPRRVFIIIIIVYIILMSSIAPMYVVYRLDMKYFPHRNKSLIGLVARSDRVRIEKISFAVNNVFMPFSAFTLVITCTIILFFKLHVSAKWGQARTKYNQCNASSRNLKVAKMVVMISTLFIVCCLPFSAIFIAFMIEPELTLEGKYRNMVFVSVGVSVILESVNSSANIFIYYRMSGRYRAIVRELFSRKSSK